MLAMHMALSHWCVGEYTFEGLIWRLKAVHCHACPHDDILYFVYGVLCSSVSSLGCSTPQRLVAAHRVWCFTRHTELCVSSKFVFHKVWCFTLAAMAPKQKRRRLERAPTIDSAAAIPFIQEASARKVQSAWYQDGSILRELAGQHAKVFGNIIPASKNCGHIEGIITWCSLCSGSEGAHHVMQEC